MDRFKKQSALAPLLKTLTFLSIVKITKIEAQCV